MDDIAAGHKTSLVLKQVTLRANQLTNSGKTKAQITSGLSQLAFWPVIDRELERKILVVMTLSIHHWSSTVASHSSPTARRGRQNTA
jgi:hypothetical protein